MEKWEERWHPLRQEWVVVAAHRQNRPWSGQVMDEARGEAPVYVSDCYLCPGNRRVGGAVNPRYDGIHVFDNDHPCVGESAPPAPPAPVGIFRNRPATGVARVVCYGPEHHLRLGRMPAARVAALLRCWRDQVRELGGRPQVRHVLVFENNGAEVGVSNPHPHCQIYATNFVFKTVETELAAARAHKAETGRVLFRDIIASETQDGRRIVADNGEALAFVPYFARYAYEVYVAPRETHASFASLADGEIDGLAEVLRRVLVKFDNLWRTPFPYVMALHTAPAADAGDGAYHSYLALHPPLRKPQLLKYLAGPEIGGGNFIADTWPEDKAAELRAADETHYLDRAAP